MKRLGLIAIVLALLATVSACGKRDEPAPTQPQSNTQPSTVAPSIMPEENPTLDTNIPDPTVNENSQGMGGMENGSTNGSTNDSANDSSGSSSSTENNDIGTDNNQNGLDNAPRSRMFRN